MRQKEGYICGMISGGGGGIGMPCDAAVWGSSVIVEVQACAMAMVGECDWAVSGCNRLCAVVM